MNNPEYFFDLPEEVHRLKIGNGIHTNLSPLSGEWNSLWSRFIQDNPDASAQQVLDELNKMADGAGITQYRAINQ